MRHWLNKIFPARNEKKAESTTGAAAKARGDEFLAQGNWAEAERNYREAVALEPHLAKAHSNLGFALSRHERDAEAAVSLRCALELDPANADTHYMLGTLAAKEAHRFEEARHCFGEALHRSPDFEAAHVALCNLLVLQRELAEAHVALDAALAHCPGSAALYRLRGEVECDEKQFAAAAASFEEALAIEPNADAALGLGQALLRLGQRTAAMAAFERAIQLLQASTPGDAKAMFNLGAALMSLGRYDEAQSWFEQSLALRPDASEAVIARGWLHLLRGEFEAGWRAYRHVRLHSPVQQRFGQPLWDGQADLTDKAILIYADQGMGDTLQLVRYVRELHARGASAVYLDAQAPLRPLLQAVPGVTRMLAMGEPLETFDFHCPLSNLPAAFGTSLDAMPDARPYIAAPPELVDAWRAKLAEDGGLRVGVVWSGNPQFRNDRQRSLFLQDLLPLFEREDCRFYLLQKDPRAVDLPDLQELLRRRSNISDLARELEDFGVTAAIVAQLDVVVTVDTAVAHLAGAMGKPVWILLPFAPDFRWLLQRADSPWYPSARLFRQPQIGDWAAVVEELGRALDSLARQ